MYKTFLPVYNSAKIIKNLSRFSGVMITNVLPPFYGSQCIMIDSCGNGKLHSTSGINTSTIVMMSSVVHQTLHIHNEQFFQVGLLDRALISLGLALSPPSTSVSSDFMVLCKCLKNYTYFSLPCGRLGLVGLAFYLVD